jgi:hypothetical protein
VKAGNRLKEPGFPASSAAQALLEFIPMEIGAGMTNLKTTYLNFKTLRTFGKFEDNWKISSIMDLI